jgi:hypothetical protein
MRLLLGLICISVTSLLSCSNKITATPQAVVSERSRVIDVVTKFQRYYNADKYSELSTLCNGELLTELKGNLYQDKFELGRLKKSRLLHYNASSSPGTQRAAVIYHLEVSNRYEKCALKVHFKLVKDLNNKIWLVEYRLIFT